MQSSPWGIRTKLIRDTIISHFITFDRPKQASLHAWPGFVASHGASAHLHTPNDLIGGVIGPGDGRIGVESEEAWSSLAQTDQQVSQLVDRSELVSTLPPANRHLFP